MLFVAKDGKKFDDYGKCADYELELDKKEEEQKKVANEKESMKQDVNDAYDNYMKVRKEGYHKFIEKTEESWNEYVGLRDKYIEKYGDDIFSGSIFKTLMDILGE